ncbi:AfsR/SARP family transcriptional regulator [Actinocrispum wychmicini]|uniref:DNA-binding SARP family transcriptional activator n=1 Tax=Actinocrispum wychmicini TaxID=1213861 RepID=A0A4R2ITM3_9PSEU|nr:AfsR/SARP family transcriptional regulator [Actinocrispum wychmicini]TCO48871.1 DNA-binding SARP family transcriptional activator [Actinocrispum wychmicini]
MRFRLLGPLEVLHAGIAADKQRTVLAMLLVHAGHVVPVSALIQEVWGDDPPRSAAPNLRSYVMQLRRLLPPDCRLATTRAGYSLHIAEDDLDLSIFEGLVAEGRFALAQSDMESASAALRAALALWRGTAAEDVPTGPTLRAAVARLTELHLGTIVDHVEVELASGRHAEVSADLRRWITRYPLRERLHGQLMLALYRSGDVPGALTAFTEARDTLANELGIDPGPELSRLHQQILRRDPLLMGRLPAAAPKPRQLPPEPGVFVGRAEELAIAGAGGVVAFHGPGGVGKSTLALKVAHAVADRYPDGQLYVDLQGSSPGLRPLDPAEVVGRFLRALGVRPEDLDVDHAEAAARYQSLLADRKVLLVLDNAADASQVIPLVPANRGCAVLITSRIALTTVDARHVRVDVFTEPDSVRLLALLAGDDRVAQEADAATEISRWCGHHPLALRIAGARLAGRPDWTLSLFGARLRDSRRRLDELRVADLGIRACFAIGYESLGTDTVAMRAFRLLGVLGVPEVGIELVSVLLDVDEVNAEYAMDRLVEVRLLDPVGAGRFRTHDLLRLYAAELAAAADPITERVGALQRALDWYLDMCRKGDGTEFDTELPCLVAVAGQAAAREPAIARFVIDLVQIIRSLAAKRGHWRELGDLARLALTVARRDHDIRGEARILAVSGTIDWRAGRIDSARAGMLRALHLWRQLGDEEGEGLARHNLGWLHMWTNDLSVAHDYLTESLQLLGKLGSPHIKSARHNLGEVLLRQGKHTEAVVCFQECLADRRRVRDTLGESITLVALGRAYCLLDARAEALRTLDEALYCCREVGNRDDEWEALLSRSEIWLRQGNAQAALADAERADELAAELSEDYGQAAAARQLARARSALGDTWRAAVDRQRAYELLKAPSTRRDPVLEELLSARL